MTDRPAPAPGRERIVTLLVTQLHRDRRSLLTGTAVFASANLALAAVVWLVPGGPLAWATVIVAFLGSVFFALTADWEFRRLALWRREVGRLVERDDAEETIGRLLADSRTARPTLALKWIHWAITTAWLISLLALIAGTGIEWTGLL